MAKHCQSHSDTELGGATLQLYYKGAIGFDGYNLVPTGEVTMTICGARSDSNHLPTVFVKKDDPSEIKAIAFEPGIFARLGGHCYEEVSGTIRANAGDNQMAVAIAREKG